MGVKISKIISQPPYIEMNQLKGKKVGIDGFNALYQFANSMMQNGEPLKDNKGRVTSHLSGLFYRTINLLENGIKPVYIFDGPPNKLKQSEIDRRKLLKKENLMNAVESYDNGFDDEAQKYYSRTTKITKEMVEESKKILSSMGIPYVNSLEDAEAQSAWMCKEKYIYASATQDYDSLVFGSPKTIRNLTLSKTQNLYGRKITRNIELISLDDVLKDLNLTQDQLIDVAILIGTDFDPGINFIGEKTALKYISKFGSIEEMIKNNISIRKEKIDLNIDFINNVRDLFKNPRHTDQFTLEWKEPSIDNLKEILCEEHDFSPNRIEKGIERMTYKPKIKGPFQDTLDSFLK